MTRHPNDTFTLIFKMVHPNDWLGALHNDSFFKKGLQKEKQLPRFLILQRDIFCC